MPCWNLLACNCAGSFAHENIILTKFISPFMQYTTRVASCVRFIRLFAGSVGHTEKHKLTTSTASISTVHGLQCMFYLHFALDLKDIAFDSCCLICSHEKQKHTHNNGFAYLYSSPPTAPAPVAPVAPVRYACFTTNKLSTFVGMVVHFLAV